MSITYIIQIDGPENLVKFGKTQNPNSRMKTLKTGLPWPLRIVALIGADVEAELKRRFVEHRVQGEWFRPTKELGEWLAKAAADGRLVKQVDVDQAYMNAVIKPRIREYLGGREPVNSQAGDLVRCILNDLLPTLAGRERELSVATKNHVTDALSKGFGPTIDAPVLVVPASASQAKAA